MEEIKISEMSLEDFEKIKDLLIEEFDEFWTANILKSELESENSKYIVAKKVIDNDMKNQTIVGFAGILISPVDTEITNIVVKKSERKKGIGTLLLDRLIEMAIKTGLETISLEVNEKNVAAGHLYEKKGFEVVGIRKKYYNRTDDAIIMTKKLNLKIF
jgi:ribosomal-protein-alanine N-acetyltransferase